MSVSEEIAVSVGFAGDALAFSLMVFAAILASCVLGMLVMMIAKAMSDVPIATGESVQVCWNVRLAFAAPAVTSTWVPAMKSVFLLASKPRSQLPVETW